MDYCQDCEFWELFKKVFVELIESYLQYELVEIFYNLVIGKVFWYKFIDNIIMFVILSCCFLVGQDKYKVIYSFDIIIMVMEMYEFIFVCYWFNIGFEDCVWDMQ